VGRRTKARECAFQILYQWQVTGERIEAVIASFWKVRSATPEARALAERLARGAQGKAEALDAEIAEAATNWRLERIAPIDRTILRLGAYELGDEAATPAAVVIDEAVELAKRFGDEGSPAFVNGLLDAIRKKLRGDGVRDPEGAKQEQ
jgi:transcription antitermination protein NusB